jgi:hypothetical protein
MADDGSGFFLCFPDGTVRSLYLKEGFAEAATESFGLLMVKSGWLRRVF